MLAQHLLVPDLWRVDRPVTVSKPVDQDDGLTIRRHSGQFIPCVWCDVDSVYAIHGIMPHANILLAIGAATMLMNSALSCGSPRSSWMASCSIAGFGWPFSYAFSCHNCSQVDCWYFWTTLLAIMSKSRCWAPATPTNSSADTVANRKIRLVMALSSFHGTVAMPSISKSCENVSSSCHGVRSVFRRHTRQRVTAAIRGRPIHVRAPAHSARPRASEAMRGDDPNGAPRTSGTEAA